MNRLLSSLIRSCPLASALAFSTLLAPLVNGSEKAEFSTPTGKSPSSLAPLKPSDQDLGFRSPFDRSPSRGPSIDMGSAGSSRPAPELDAKTRAKLLDALDNKRNWILNDGQKKAGMDNNKDNKEKDPFDEVQGHRRTALERRILEESPSLSKKSGSRSEKIDYVWKDPASEREKSLKPSSSQTGADSTTSSDSDKTGTQASFSSPFEAAKAESLSGDRDGASLKQGDVRDFRPGSLGESRERMQQTLNSIGSKPGAQTGGKTGLDSFAEFGSGRNNHLQQMQSLLGGGSASASGVAGLFAPPPATTRSPVSAAFQNPVAPNGAGLFSPSAAPLAPRLERPSRQPSPNVLPLPRRDF